jgi:hypothetical protein
MGGLLIPIVFVITLASALSICFRLLKTPRLSVSPQKKYTFINEPCKKPNLNILNCRVRLTEQNKENRIFRAFNVEICGTICAPDDTHNATVQITIADLTDGLSKAKPVHGTAKRWQRLDSSEFYYKADLGRLPERLTVISDWMTVAQIDLQWLTLPRRGKRSLQFTTSVSSRQNGQELACAQRNFIYENTVPGYIDLEENIQRTKMLAVPLAFAVSAADKKLFDCEIELIKNWARENIDLSKKGYNGRNTAESSKPAGTSAKAKRKLEKMLRKTVLFFRNGKTIDTYKICSELTNIAPIAARCDILELCMHVAQAKGTATTEELTLLKNMADWLDVDTDRFRTMAERILPLNMHQVKDKEIILGVTSDMSEEQTRQALNKEYRKWNARVTSSDPEIRNQADLMLEFIAEARKDYVV